MPCIGSVKLPLVIFRWQDPFPRCLNSLIKLRKCSHQDVVTKTGRYGILSVGALRSLFTVPQPVNGPLTYPQLCERFFWIVVSSSRSDRTAAPIPKTFGSSLKTVCIRCPYSNIIIPKRNILNFELLRSLRQDRLISKLRLLP